MSESQEKDPILLRSQIESVLFASGKAISYAKLATSVESTPAQVRTLVDQLSAEYSSEKRGICIVSTETSAQMVTAPENASVVATLLSKDIHEPLSDSAAETLAIILYQYPISRPEIEHIRGVNCTYMLRMLLLRGLVEKSVDSESRSVVYMPTMELLQHLGVPSKEQLPSFSEITKQLTELQPATT